MILQSILSFCDEAIMWRIFEGVVDCFKAKESGKSFLGETKSIESLELRLGLLPRVWTSLGASWLWDRMSELVLARTDLPSISR